MCDVRCSEIRIHQWDVPREVRVRFPSLWKQHLPVHKAQVKLFEASEPGADLTLVACIDLLLQKVAHDAAHGLSRFYVVGESSHSRHVRHYTS